MRNCYLLLLTLLMTSLFADAQTTKRTKRCGTMEALDNKLKDPHFKARFEANRKKMVDNAVAAKGTQTAGMNDTIPVVIHIIMNNPSLVTDAICQSQIDVLNEDYQGKNADTTRIPAAFKSLFGKNNITFMLAKTAPDGSPTTGIERRTNNVSYSMFNYTNGKKTATGGLDGWDPNKYFNVWVVSFSDGTLGVSVFPGDPDPIAEHGFMCDYRNWGRGASYLDPDYNKGRTATHEIGHFFNLFHIWGDDGSACTGTDFDGTLSWDDTPNQAGSTLGNPDFSGTGTVKTDGCSSSSPGIMYQNYMDYSDDVALVMFTKGQWLRMEQAMQFAPDRKNIFNSTTYKAPPTFPNDAGIAQIVTPLNDALICSGSSITPTIKLTNFGTNALTGVNIMLQLNGGAPVLAQHWTGNLAQYASVVLTMPAITIGSGFHTIKYYTTLPNGVADQNSSNDGSAEVSITYQPTVLGTIPINEGFEASFPPSTWSIVNPDSDVTWEKVTTASKSGTSSIRVDNFNYENGEGQVDYLKLPALNISSASYTSASLSFHYAYKRYSSFYNDSLEVLVSTDCGNTWMSLWKKGGSALSTSSGTQTTQFIPTSSQWSSTPATISLNSYMNQDIILAFRNKSDYGQALYLDDVAVTAVPASMPVTLVSFQGSRKSRFVNLLQWKTATELNSAYFIVERSTDGVQFQETGRVEAAGNSSEAKLYNYNDDRFGAGTSYYRLKMVDKDGKYEFSKIINIKDESEHAELSFYPNPVQQVLNIRLNSISNQVVQVNVLDIQGRTILTRQVNLNTGLNLFNLNTESLPPGTYLLNVGGDSPRTAKFIKN